MSGELVHVLGESILTLKNLTYVPKLLIRIINEDLWQERIVSANGEHVRFERFVDFVETKPLEGLGTDIDTLKKLCRDNVQAIDAIDRVTIGSQGAPIGNNNAASDKTNRDNITVCFEEPERGTSAAYALRRLRTSRPDLHARVLAGELSPHAASVEAGHRRRMLQVRIDDMDALAASLIRNLTPEQIDELVVAIARQRGDAA